MMQSLKVKSRWTLLLLVTAGTGLAAPHGKAGTLELTVIDKATGKPVPARVRVRDVQGQDHVPPEAVTLKIVKDQWFYTAGAEQIELPAGEAIVRVERGTEYRPIKTTIKVPDTGTVRFEAGLERWIDMRARGYVSGENHLHVKPTEAPVMPAGEDLNFGTILSWWNGPREQLPADWKWATDLSFGGATTPTSVFDAEVEHAWGAVYIIGSRQPLTLKADQKRANLPYVKEGRAHGAMICYQGGWSREVLVDALNGLVDVVNVCNNNFHRHKFQPRKKYSNLLNVEGFPDYPDTPEDMMRMNTETYYRLLNCGLKLAAGAGTATGAKDAPVGYNRAYVRAGKNPILADFYEAWRQGKNFVTNGPMIFLSVDPASGTGEPLHPGDTITLPQAGGKLTIKVQALSEQPLRSLEIVANGRVIGTASVDPDARSAELTVTHTFDEGSWIAARCTEEDLLLSDEELAVYRVEPNYQAPCRLRFAHTSPIYVTVDGRGPRVATSIREAEKMLDAFVRFAHEAASKEFLPEILEAVESARIALKGMAAE